MLGNSDAERTHGCGSSPGSACLRSMGKRPAGNWSVTELYIVRAARARARAELTFVADASRILLQAGRRTRLIAHRLVLSNCKRRDGTSWGRVHGAALEDRSHSASGQFAMQSAFARSEPNRYTRLNATTHPPRFRPVWVIKQGAWVL